MTRFTCNLYPSFGFNTPDGKGHSFVSGVFTTEEFPAEDAAYIEAAIRNLAGYGHWLHEDGVDFAAQLIADAEGAESRPYLVPDDYEEAAVPAEGTLVAAQELAEGFGESPGRKPAEFEEGYTMDEPGGGFEVPPPNEPLVDAEPQDEDSFDAVPPPEEPPSVDPVSGEEITEGEEPPWMKVVKEEEEKEVRNAATREETK